MTNAQLAEKLTRLAAYLAVELGWTGAGPAPEHLRPTAGNLSGGKRRRPCPRCNPVRTNDGGAP